MMFSNWSLLLQRNAIDFTFLFYILNIANLLLAGNLSFLVFHLLSWDPMGFSISPGSPVIIWGLLSGLWDLISPIRDQTRTPDNESMES